MNKFLNSVVSNIVLSSKKLQAESYKSSYVNPASIDAEFKKVLISICNEANNEIFFMVGVELFADMEKLIREVKFQLDDQTVTDEYVNRQFNALKFIQNESNVLNYYRFYDDVISNEIIFKIMMLQSNIPFLKVIKVTLNYFNLNDLMEPIEKNGLLTLNEFEYRVVSQFKFYLDCPVLSKMSLIENDIY